MRFRLAVAVGVFLTASLQSAFSASISYSQIISFGDSLSDTGNASILTGGTAPGSRSDYWNGRFTDGPTTTPGTPSPTGVWVEQLASKLNVADPLPALTGGTNYAVGGADTGSNNLFFISDQVGLYLTTHLSGASSTALFTIWGGANDLFDGKSGRTAADNLYANILSLSGSGAKNFLWLNLPPLGDTPYAASTSTSAALNTEANNFNTEWATNLAKLQAAGVNVTGVDINNLFLEIAKNPLNSGFANVTDPAQGANVDPNTFLFWDPKHPTTAAHALVADLAFSDLAGTTVPEPMNVGLMLIGLGALVAVRQTRRKD
jgi:phospholipase/lecithinase/hemolysin